MPNSLYRCGYIQVVVFTASEKEYADQAIDMLDPSGKLIHHRLYRESCIMLKGNYVKDISDLGKRCMK